MLSCDARGRSLKTTTTEVEELAHWFSILVFPECSVQFSEPKRVCDYFSLFSSQNFNQSILLCCNFVVFIFLLNRSYFSF